MSDIFGLVRVLKQKAAGAPRFMVAIAGAPGSGKSTLAHNLAAELVSEGETAIVVPMDGFHFDDSVLNARGHRPRKGAPFTFDAAGFETLLKRIKAREPEVAIAVFDRTLELSRAAADIVDEKAKFVLVEGNYLLLAEEPWSRLSALFDFSVSIDVPRDELERRLIRRWLDHGFDMEYAKNWVASNDLLNIDAVISGSAKADFVLKQEPARL
jgi:pantothenate kinase